jgi:CheY-like chemotaxis protein
VVLTDLAMPGMDGTAATRALLARHPRIGVVVLTMHESDEAVRDGGRARLAAAAAPPGQLPGPRWRWVAAAVVLVSPVQSHNWLIDDLRPSVSTRRGLAAAVGRHSGARRAQVELTAVDGTLQVTITDDGHGSGSRPKGSAWIRRAAARRHSAGGCRSTRPGRAPW